VFFAADASEKEVGDYNFEGKWRKKHKSTQNNIF
jgi:hypothetical protein